MPVNSVKNRSKSQHHKNSESKSLHFMREVNEEFEKMIEQAEGESLYCNMGPAMTWGSAAKHKK